MEGTAAEITWQEFVISELKETFGPLVYTEDHVNFRLVGYYTKGHQVVQAIGPTWRDAIDILKKKATSMSRVGQRGRWPWRSTLITR